MTLRLCVPCATIYDCDPDQPRICPRCGKSLELRQLEADNAPTIATVSSWATWGQREQAERVWRVG